MTIRQTLLETLVTEHPEACRLIMDLVQAIELEKRQEANCDPEVKETFCLSEMTSIASATIENLSLNDATPVESDHALGVMSALFSDLEEAGLSFQSVETEQQIGSAFKQPTPVNFTLYGDNTGTVTSDTLVKDVHAVGTLDYCNGRWKVIALSAPDGKTFAPYAHRSFLTMEEAERWVTAINESVVDSLRMSFFSHERLSSLLPQGAC